MVLHRKIFHLTLKKLYCRLFVLSECFNTWQAVESSKSVWGKISMVDAEKRLLGHALEDPDTQHFVIFLCHFLHAELHLVLDQQVFSATSYMQSLFSLEEHT